RVTITASSTGLTSDTLSFTVVHGAAVKIARPDSTGSGEWGSERWFSAPIEDAAGNTVTDSTASVGYAQTAGTGSVSGAGSDTAVAGVSTKTLTRSEARRVGNEGSSTGVASETHRISVVPGGEAE